MLLTGVFVVPLSIQSGGGECVKYRSEECDLFYTLQGSLIHHNSCALSVLFSLSVSDYILAKMLKENNNDGRYWQYRPSINSESVL